MSSRKSGKSDVRALDHESTRKEELLSAGQEPAGAETRLEDWAARAERTSLTSHWMSADCECDDTFFFLALSRIELLVYVTGTG
jgi:hypothetical protein